MTRFALCILCLMVMANVAGAQSNAPAVEYQSLLNMRYYEADGGFLADDLQLVFAPTGNPKLTFVITTSTGQEVARVPLRSERLRNFEAFRALHPDGVPGVIRIGRAGNFVIAVKLGDQTITALPFSLKEENSTDPYNPKRTFVRDGAWRDVAYFSSPIDKPDTPIRFNWWISLRELPAGLKRPLCTVHVMHGGQEIATTRAPVVPDYYDWQFFKVQLIQPKGPGQQWLTSSSLTKRDGELTVVVKVNGQPVKSYRGQIKGGRFQGLPRSQIGVEPQTDFISTRLIDLSRDGGCDYCMLDMLWLTRVTR